MAEELAGFLSKIEIKSKYIHSDVDTLERVKIMQGLREDEFDVLIGVNLLREGLDLPEVSLGNFRCRQRRFFKISNH